MDVKCMRPGIKLQFFQRNFSSSKVTKTEKS